MKKDVNVALIGLSAYGTLYAKALLEQEHEARLSAIIDPFADKNTYYQTVKSFNIPKFNSLEEYTKKAGKNVASLAVIASPIHLHSSQTCEALKAGMNVLCEKPISGSVQDALKMLEASKRARRFVVIGYNWSFFKEILQIKQDFLDGKFGKVKRMKTIVLGPRSLNYYNRNNWAGKIASLKREWILDSPINNAHSHYLHNMFFIVGKNERSSAKPISVKAELYRANQIENYDTAVIECAISGGAKVFFVTSHATRNYHPIFMEFEFEKGTLIGNGEEFKMHWNDGSIDYYGKIDQNQHLNKLWQCVAAVKGSGAVPSCGIEAALSQTICMNAAQESPAKIINFPQPYIKTREEVDSEKTVHKFVYVDGLDEILIKCYEDWKMPSDLGCEWAIPSRWIDCSDYQKFPSTNHFAR